jgi:hypothetical protein
VGTTLYCPMVMLRSISSGYNPILSYGNAMEYGMALCYALGWADGTTYNNFYTATPSKVAKRKEK